MVKQESDHLHAALTNGCLTSRLVVLTCLIALPVPAVAQAPPAPATLGPAVVALHISGRVPQPGGAVALLLADGSQLLVAASDIDEASTRSANDALNGKSARGRATRRDTVVVVRITARASDADGSIMVLLASGSKIALASSHIDAELTRSINDRISVKEARGGPPANQSPRVPGPAPAVSPPAGSEQPQPVDNGDISSWVLALPPAVITRCTDRYPADAHMLGYCLREQADAADALDQRSFNANTWGIRRVCAWRWTDDLANRDWCERTQIEARRWMGGTLR